MNILYLHSHDTGRAIQPHGHPVRTPALQALADSGVLFRHAHCAAPTCSPSRAALLTGETAHQAGMVALAHRGGKLRHPEHHLAGFLARQGFESVLAGISHVGSVDDCGYTRQSTVDHRDADAIAAYAIDFLRNRDPGKPFFLDVGYVETHRTEWVCHGFSQEHLHPGDGDGDPSRVLPPAPLPDTPETRRDWLDFTYAVERLDRAHGQVLGALEAAGLADDTLVIATTDHGIAFPEHKCSLTVHGTGVFLILRAPGLLAGQVTDAMVSHLDVYPTICDLLGTDRPDWLQGKSLLPILRGDEAILHDSIFAEVTFHAAFEPKRSVRTDRWNYIRNFAAPCPPVLPNCDDGPSKRLLMTHGLANRIVTVEELYDLVFDPQERHNRAGDPALGGVLEDHRLRLAAWMKRTDDPLLEPNPAHALPLSLVVNPRDGEQPSSQTAADWDPAEWTRVAHSV